MNGILGKQMQFRGVSILLIITMVMTVGQISYATEMSHTYSIGGMVVEPRGHAVEAVVVTAKQGQDVSSSTMTEADGSFLLTGLLPGTYDITFEKAKHIVLPDTTVLLGEQDLLLPPTMLPLIGDVNLDGFVNAADMVPLNRHALGIELITTPVSILAADSNQDGLINGADMVPLVRGSLGYVDVQQWSAKAVYSRANLVFHNGKQYTARHWTLGQEPGLIDSPWQEQTEEWRSFNRYVAGDVVWHEGQPYRARTSSHNISPLNSGAWQMIDPLTTLVQNKIEVDRSNSEKVLLIENGQIDLTADPDAPLMPMESPDDKQQFPYEIKYVANVLPVMVGEQVVQANDIVVVGDRAYVAYNVAGPVFAGAIQIIDISTPSLPKVVYELRLEGMNVHAIHYDQVHDELVFGGGADILVWGGRSYIAKFRTSAALQSDEDLVTDVRDSLTFLPSYHLTSITQISGQSNYFVAVGAEDGQIIELNRDFTVHTQRGIGDVRDITTLGDKFYALAGTHHNPATTGRVVRSLTDEETDLPIIDFASPEHKAVIDLQQGDGGSAYAYLALSEHGLQVWRLKHNSSLEELLVYELPNPPTMHSQTNSVSSSGDLVFLANGGYGFRILKVNGYTEGDEPQSPYAELVGFHEMSGDLYPHQYSANHIVFHQNILFVASGSSGLNIYLLSPDDDDDDDDDGDVEIGANHPGSYIIFNDGGSPLSLPSGSKIGSSVYSRFGLSVLSASTIVDGSLVSLASVDLGQAAQINGSVCALGGNVAIASSNVNISGNVNSAGSVNIGSSGVVSGAVHASGDVVLKAMNSQVGGDIHSGRNVRLESATTAHNNVYAGGDIYLLNTQSAMQGIQGNAHARGIIERQNNTNISGSAFDGSSPAPPRIDPQPPAYCISGPVAAPPLQSFTSGEHDITVPQSGTLAIAPGDHRHLIINGGSTTVLTSGNYVFSQVSGANWGQTLRLDLSSGQALNVFVKGNLHFSGSVAVSLDGTNYTRIDNLDVESAKVLARLVYWEIHGDFTITTNNSIRQWFGTVLTQNDMDLASGFYGVGSYAVTSGKITIDSNPTMHYSLADFAKNAW